MDHASEEKLQKLADAWHHGLSPGDGIGLLWHLALRRYPSAMTELSRRIGEDGLSAADPFFSATEARLHPDPTGGRKRRQRTVFEHPFTAASIMNG